MQLLHFYGAEFADLAEVVAPEIDQHIVLGKLLFIREQLAFQHQILLLRFAARTGTRQRKGMQDTVFEFY